MCLESTRKTASTDVWKRPVTTCGKPHTLLSSLQWQDGTPSDAFWEREHFHSDMWKTASHCLVEQHWQHMEIHPVLNKCALNAQEKLHPLMFEREQWQHVENPIHCLVHYSDKMENHPLLSARALATCGKPHPLLSETAGTTYGNPSTAY